MASGGDGKKANMKKEVSGDRRASATRRPSSVKAGGSGTISNNQALNKAKQQVDDLTKERDHFKTEHDIINKNYQTQHENQEILLNKIIDDAKAKGFDLEKEHQGQPCFDVPIDSVLKLLNNLAYKQEVVKKRKRGSVESRVEELETRITHLNMEVAKLIQLRLTLEHGLEDIQDSNSLKDIKEKARFLLFEARKY